MNEIKPATEDIEFWRLQAGDCCWLGNTPCMKIIGGHDNNTFCDLITGSQGFLEDIHTPFRRLKLVGQLVPVTPDEIKKEGIY